jgi:TRAP-type C4-dicarboxylate transport system permease small subunit
VGREQERRTVGDGDSASARADGTRADRPGAPLALLEGLSHCLERAGSAMGDVAGWGYLACALFITFDVVSRRFLGFSSQGTVEISGYLLAFGITWGLAYALSARGHIRVDVLVTRFPLGLRAYAHALALAFLTVFAGLLALRAWSVVGESWELGAKETSALTIPLVIPQAPWAAGLTVFAALAAVLMLRTLLLLAGGRHQAVDRLLASRSLEEETEEALEAAGVAPAPPAGGEPPRAAGQRPGAAR